MIEGNKAEAQKRLEFGENLPPKRGRARTGPDAQCGPATRGPSRECA